MAINKELRKSGYFASATTNAKRIISNLTKRIKKIDKYGERVLEQVCILFVEEARQRLLDSGYDVRNLLNNITYRKYGENKYRVGIRNNNQKEIMYFLEFGTGVVGEDDPHPAADEFNWEYNVGSFIEDWASDEHDIPTGYNSLNEFVGFRGWWYNDPKTGRIKFTSGLHAVAYIYDTMQEDNMKRIIERAKEIVKLNG